MKPIRVKPENQTADLETLRRQVDALRGAARCRPGDCTRLRFLIRDVFVEAFTDLAAAHGFRTEPDSREPFAR